MEYSQDSAWAGVVSCQNYANLSADVIWGGCQWNGTLFFQPSSTLKQYQSQRQVSLSGIYSMDPLFSLTHCFLCGIKRRKSFQGVLLGKKNFILPFTPLTLD